MKKITATFAAFAVAAALFAETLPNGLEAEVLRLIESNGTISEVVLARPLEIETKYGTFTAMANSTISFYESGAIRQLYFDGVQEIKTKAGTFKIESAPKTDSFGSKDKPFVLYENGSVKQAYLYGTSIPEERTAAATTPLGTMSVRTREFITFHDDETIESAVPSDGSTAAFLTAINPKAKFQSKEKLSFYKSGKVLQFTPSVPLPHPAGFSTKARAEIILSENGNIISCTPDRNSTVKFNGQYWKLSPSAPFKTYEADSVAEMTIDAAGSHFLAGEKIGFYFDAPAGTKTLQGEFAGSSETSGMITLAFYEKYVPKSASAASPFVFKAGDFSVSATYIDFTEQGEFKTMAVSPSIDIPMKSEKVMIPDGDMGKNIESVKNSGRLLSRLYFRSGRLSCGTGTSYTVYPGHRFFNRSEPCIVMFKDGKPAETIPAERLSKTSDVIFDENGRPTAYTAAADKFNPDAIEIIEIK